jgi:hypothetical protein
MLDEESRAEVGAKSKAANAPPAEQFSTAKSTIFHHSALDKTDCS